MKLILQAVKALGRKMESIDTSLIKRLDNMSNRLDDKMSSTNPVATGSFSMGRYEGSVVGANSHTEGRDATASGNNSHAEGDYTSAYGNNSHAEGESTAAYGNNSHAEGENTCAYGKNSHAEGVGTIARDNNSHVEGKFNIDDSDEKHAHIVGNGWSKIARSNAHTLDWEGNAWYQGDVYVGSTSGVNRDEGSKKLATEEYVTTLINSKLSEFGLAENTSF